MSKKLLVIGARKKSIGQAVAKMWGDMFDAPAVTAGLSGDEEHVINLSDTEEIPGLLNHVKPDHIVVTVGVNRPKGDDTIEDWMLEHMLVNCMYPMNVLDAWFEVEGGIPPNAHFVAMSSNSAHIPRSQSMAYCASKAALSMALRVAARDVGKAEFPMSVYGWEPGLVKGTPMSGERGGTRMLGLPHGMHRRALAHQIVSALAFGGPEYNGSLIRLDAGEV